MSDLKEKHTIKTKNYKTVVVGQKLGEGGQGAVYRVDYDGKPKALKWYSGKKLKSPDKFYANLENNIKKGRPTKAFLWPEDITEHEGMAFGYIMDLRPDEYKDFSRFLIGKEKFASMTARVNTAMQIIAGFRALHQKGYSYQDLNDGNFFINPQNGNVLICDNDNVSAHGTNTGIVGKPRYMAPEIVANGAKPSMRTDDFSLAVVLFLLWTHNHPLEGKAAHPACMTDEEEKRIFGVNPVFVWDKTDDSNRPVKGMHEGAIRLWQQLLHAYLKDTFIKAFSKELLKDPQIRIQNQDWLRIFIRMRAEIYKCSCGKVYFSDPVARNPCPGCKKTNVFPMYIKTQRYKVPVHQRTRLYACHTEKSSDDFETLSGEVSANGSDFVLKNVTKNNWLLGDGTTIAPNGAVALKKGMKINFGLVDVEVI